MISLLLGLLGTTVICTHDTLKVQGTRLQTGEALVYGKIVQVDLVLLLKQYPELRTKKNIKAAAAQMVVKSHYKMPMSLSTAYIATKGTRVGKPPGLPHFNTR